MEYGPAPRTPKKRWPGWIFMGAASDTTLTAHGGNRRRADTSKPQIPLVARSSPPSPRDRRQTSTPRFEPRMRPCQNGRALTPHARARYLYALARTVQKHSRRLAVLETMDNGKPIRESRDIDIPLVARHFYYHAGWAQLLHQEFPGLRGVRSRRADHPLEFPHADAGLEDCAGTGHGQHGRTQTGGIYAAHRAGVRGDLRGNRTSARRGQYCYGRWFDGRSTGEASRRGQDRFHRFYRSGPRHPQCDGGQP